MNINDYGNYLMVTCRGGKKISFNGMSDAGGLKLGSNLICGDDSSVIVKFCFFKNGKRHREGGPAVERLVERHSGYYLFGIELSKREYFDIVELLRKGKDPDDLVILVEQRCIPSDTGEDYEYCYSIIGANSTVMVSKTALEVHFDISIRQIFCENGKLIVDHQHGTAPKVISFSYLKANFK